MKSENTTKGRSCRHCGCHERDACYHPEFGNCWWVNDNECSHCIEVPGKAVRWSLFPKETTAEDLTKAYAEIMRKRQYAEDLMAMAKDKGLLYGTHKENNPE
ncbi:hypothetical protein AAOE16_18175 [Ekhidna sp. MALMAid0563]|uniref:hypothetical protein n=1 Tax=Ekhidna sp. MALMAid0563 TaxID=3143937 RepID=UPI0032DEB0BC